MFGSFNLGSIRGIRIRVHWTFLALAAFFLWVSEPGEFALRGLALLAVFLAVFLHEMGHSVVAQHFGIRVLDITFWPLGGMARMSAIPESPRIEGWVAFAGPLVNFLLAGLTLLLWIVAPSIVPPRFLNLVELALQFWLLINLSMGAFNLLPAFPMDGGRLLRAFLARKRSWLRATEIAVRSGRWVALGAALFGLWAGYWTIPLVAIFLWFSGASELIAVRLRHAASPFGFAAAAPADPPPAPPSPSEQPRAGARRPYNWEAQLPPDGLSADQVERLEHFRGRLRALGERSDPGESSS